MEKQAILSLVGKQTGESPTIETLDDFGLGGIDCPICQNKGYIVSRGEDGFSLISRECECMSCRRALRSLKRSGLEGLIEEYTLDSYQTPDRERCDIKQKALDFLAASEGWFFIGGRPGSGKTHICTAICGELIRRGAQVKYMLWRDEATQLKAGITDREWYAEQMERLKTVKVLYIDDFWKSRRTDGQMKVTDGDVNLAFEIINARYISESLRTVISSELSLEEILSVDEGIGRRIYTRSRGYIKKAPDEDWSLR